MPYLRSLGLISTKCTDMCVESLDGATVSGELNVHVTAHAEAAEAVYFQIKALSQAEVINAEAMLTVVI